MSSTDVSGLALGIWIVLGLSAMTPCGPNGNPESRFRPNIPKVWDEAALADWATRVAGLNARATHISEKQ